MPRAEWTSAPPSDTSAADSGSRATEFAGCRDGAPHALNAGLDRAGGERGLARLNLHLDRCSAGDTCLVSRLRSLRGGAQRGARIDAQLAAEELRTGLHSPRRARLVARGIQAADEQDVGVLVEGDELHELSGMTRRAIDLAARE